MAHNVIHDRPQFDIVAKDERLGVTPAINVSKFRRGGRSSGLGTVFKREFKITDIEGSKLKDAIVSPAFTDLFDGEAEFFPLLEDTTTLKKGEMPIGNTFAS